MPCGGKTGAYARGMTPDALRKYFASNDDLVPLVDAVDASIDGDVLLYAMEERRTDGLEPYFVDNTSWADLLDLERHLRQFLKTEMLQHAEARLEVQLGVLRSEVARLEHAEHKARAAACGAELLMQEERDKWEKHLAVERAAARSRERGHAQALERLKSQHLAEMAQHEVAQRDAEAAQRKAMEAEKAAATVQLTAEAEAKCAAKLEEMSERLDALQICMDAEAARADAASARAEVAERRAQEAEAKLSRKEEADVEAAVSFMMAPAKVMAAAKQERAVVWAAALEISE